MMEIWELGAESENMLNRTYNIIENQCNDSSNREFTVMGLLL